ncbi:respiratory nitrate reductase subunit gamma [Streptomyces griseofuscus]
MVSTDRADVAAERLTRAAPYFNSRPSVGRPAGAVARGRPGGGRGPPAAAAPRPKAALRPRGQPHRVIPESFTRWLGMAEHAYRLLSAIGGTVAALVMLLGVVIPAFRRTAVPRVQATTGPVDWAALVLPAIVLVLGIIPTMGVNHFGYGYRQSVALWFRGLSAENPGVAVICHAPLIHRIHAPAAWAILAVWPLARLVHAWSVPLWYLWRPYVLYRGRAPAHPAGPGTGGHRRRRIGVRH